MECELVDIVTSRCAGAGSEIEDPNDLRWLAMKLKCCLVTHVNHGEQYEASSCRLHCALRLVDKRIDGGSCHDETSCEISDNLAQVSNLFVFEQSSSLTARL